MRPSIDISKTSYARLFSRIDFSKADYLALPRNKQPLLLIPPGRRMAELTLGLYLPQGCKARLAVRGLKVASSANLLRRVLPALEGYSSASQGTSDTAPFSQADIDAGHVGFLLCNPEHGCARSVAVMVVDAVPRIIKWVEVSGTAALQHEASTIRQLSAKHVSGCPTVLAEGGEEQTHWFVMDYLAQSGIRSVGEKPSMRLLHDWMSEDAVNPVETGLIRSIWKTEELPVFQQAFDRLSQLRIRRAWMHGDYVGWNLRSGQSGLVAIDWEWGREDGLAGLDLCYGLLQEALLVKKRSPRRALSYVISGAKRPACKAYLEAAGWYDSLDLWLKTGTLYRHFRKPCPELLEVLDGF